jgi:hypothetical protein
MGLQQVNGSQELDIVSYNFYNGTGSSVTLKEGEAVAYCVDDTLAPVTPSASQDQKIARGRRVQTPVTANLGGYAGCVAPSSAGKVIADGTSAQIDVIRPRKGDAVRLYTNVNCTKASSLLGITNAGGRTHVTIADATINIDLVAIALETVDRSSTNGTVLARFV